MRLTPRTITTCATAWLLFAGSYVHAQDPLHPDAARSIVMSLNRVISNPADSEPFRIKAIHALTNIHRSAQRPETSRMILDVLSATLENARNPIQVREAAIETLRGVAERVHIPQSKTTVIYTHFGTLVDFDKVLHHAMANGQLVALRVSAATAPEGDATFTVQLQTQNGAMPVISKTYNNQFSDNFSDKIAVNFAYKKGDAISVSVKKMDGGGTQANNVTLTLIVREP